MLAVLAGVKSCLVFVAFMKEKRLHHREHRDQWLTARILAELCRSAVAMWPLPLQPLDANDEEDFPRLKRLIRTLRLMRAMDREAAAHGSDRLAGETSLEANMRAACEDYRVNRLLDQADKYYGKTAAGHRATEKRWRRRFKASLVSAMVAGLVLAGYYAWHSYFGPELYWLEKFLDAVLIVAPFFATYCLGMITIEDSRRRALRYGEMQHYLHRLGDTLLNCHSNPSRLRLIEHAERMLIEEQHEWFSATRNANI